MDSRIILRSFQPEDQAAVKALILDGLEERWGAIDPSKNPDLEDIAAAYPGGFFRVAEINGRIVGTGALVLHAEGGAEIRRMSVRRNLRRRGLGGAILGRLIEDARSSGNRTVILETTSTWTDAVAFYQRRGFRITHHQGGDTYFRLELNPAPASVV